MTKKKFVITFLAAILIVLVLFFLSLYIFHEHELEKEEIQAATCTTPGILKESCTWCTFSQETEIPILDHTMEEYITHKEPTCTEDGSATFKCSVCGEIEERKLFAGHNFSGDECTKCGAIKSNKSPDTWYTLTANNVFHFQNADVTNAVPMSGGRVFMVTYFPVCTDCHIRGKIRMVGVSVSTPVSETLWCDFCGTVSYPRFKIEY